MEEKRNYQEEAGQMPAPVEKEEEQLSRQNVEARTAFESMCILARQFPRDVQRCLHRIEDMITADKETAEECFYVLRRKDQYGHDAPIEGLSIRMAEIIMNCWENLDVQTRMVGNDGRMVTMQCTGIDLEKNTRVTKEVQRSIMSRTGKTFSQDMQTVTANAAASIALRNTVLTLVPKAITKKIVEKAKQIALGQAIDLETGRKNCLANFAKIGVTEDMICNYLEIDTVEAIGGSELLQLRGTWNAIKEGTTTVQEEFIQPMVEREAKEKAERTASENEKKITKAMEASFLSEQQANLL